MTEQEKKMKKYCACVERRLNLPKDVKDRVMNDFRSSINARREAGETDEQIIAELGTPKEAAAVLNEQMKEYAYQKSRWRWAALAVAIIGGLMLSFGGLAGLEARLYTMTIGLLRGMSINESASLGIIGGADGPTAIFITSAPSLTRWIVWIIVTAMGILGFWYFGHMKKK